MMTIKNISLIRNCKLNVSSLNTLPEGDYSTLECELIGIDDVQL